MNERRKLLQTKRDLAVSLHTLTLLTCSTDPAWTFYIKVNRSRQYQHTAAAFRDWRGEKSEATLFPSSSYFFVQESAWRVWTSGDLSPETSFIYFLFTRRLRSFVIPRKKTDDSHNGGGDAGMDRALPLPPPALWWTVLDCCCCCCCSLTHMLEEVTTDYSFKSHLSISPPETSCPLIKGDWQRKKGERNHAKMKTGGMCFCTWWRWFRPRLRSVRRWEGERDEVSPPASAVFSRGKPTERHVDSN